MLRVRGEIEKGTTSDIKFQQIEQFANSKNAYYVLRNTHDLTTKETEFGEDIDVKNIENVEEEMINLYSNENPSDFNSLIPQLIHALSIEKQEGETVENFNNRLLEESKKILRL